MAMTLVFRLFFIQFVFTAVTALVYSCLPNSTCGCSSNSAVLSKIVGGEQAQTDTWGWIASIRIGNSHICGGSLISSTLVLTAAHCLRTIKSIASLRVNVGSNYLFIIRQQRTVSRIYIHHDYDSTKLVNDIAIISLSSPIDMNDSSISLICLPSIKTTEYPPMDIKVVAIGWGVLSAGDNNPSNSLQQVTLKTISANTLTCRNTIQDISSQFCSGARGGAKDTCQGDSGGPLMIFSNGQWILAGITSYGIGCALADYPGVYTRVAFYTDWISCFLTNNTICIENNTLKQDQFSSIGSSICYNHMLLLFLCVIVTISVAYTCDRQSRCGCSKRSSVIISKIINGEPVSLSHSWGWMASLRRNDQHQCGASLITTSHVITAAHCVKHIESLSQLSLNFDTRNKSNIGQLRNISHVYIHPEYDQRSFTNDIAILRLDKPVDLNNSNVALLCLPSKSDFNLEKAEYPPIGENLIAIGWGTTDPYTRIPTDILQQVTIRAIDQNEFACYDIIYDTKVQFCAGLLESRKDTCQGDSGGPLMLFKKGIWVLAGVTSYGSVCANPNTAGVYTRIARYVSYIRETIKNDYPSISNTARLELINLLSSSANILYQKSMIQFYFLWLFILYRKFFE
ncbi:unnamed protein product [Rotaria magnacalcarata]|uniref:Peptidase S1 domain-containing protein n=1 Tax=Rotaria magnacalcarata TaxID=392030 RepID=A0A8S2QLD8_9BILA|nr:unnamed protein product [Rotaria magnacalcarata]